VPHSLINFRYISIKLVTNGLQVYACSQQLTIVKPVLHRICPHSEFFLGFKFLQLTKPNQDQIQLRRLTEKPAELL
jgi:hypothetical protein